MFDQNFIIDSVQETKKKVINTFVINDTFKTELIKLVDSETEFVKGINKQSLAIAETFWKNASQAIAAKKAA